MTLTAEQKKTLIPLVDAAVAARNAAEDAERVLTRAVDVARRALGAPADAVFDHSALCFCRRTPSGLEPL